VLLNVACFYTCLLRNLKVDNSSYLQLLSNKMLMAVMVFTALLKPPQSQMSNSLLIGYCLLHKLVCSGLCVVLQVLALRRPFLHRVLDYEDEFFALLMLVLETHSLRTTGFFLCIPPLFSGFFFWVLEPSVFVSILFVVQSSTVLLFVI
jgi:hypothetical protein